MGTQTLTVLAQELDGTAPGRAVAEGRGVAFVGKYQARTTRQIPVFMLTCPG